jgi:hypothetical protein
LFSAPTAQEDADVATTTIKSADVMIDLLTVEVLDVLVA